MPSDAPLRVAVFFHSGDVTGPFRTLEPRLRLLSQRADLTVLFPWGGAGARGLAADFSGRTARYSPLTVPDSVSGAVSLPWRLALETRTLRRLIRELRPTVAVVVSSFLPTVLLACRLERVPTVVYAAEILDGASKRGSRRRLGRFLLTQAVERLSTAVVACSEAVASGYGRATVVYPGIADEAPLSPREREDDDGPYLAAVGNLTRGRGQDVLLEAVAVLRDRLPGTRCIVAGIPHPRAVDEAFRDELVMLAEELGIADRVEFRGFVEDPRTVFAEADIVVNPARFAEPFGRVAAEALVAGRPVVASMVGAIPEVLRHGSDALLVPPEDPQALADAVERLWSDPGLRKQMVESGRRRILDEFPVEAGSEQFGRVVFEAAARARFAQEA